MTTIKPDQVKISQIAFGALQDSTYVKSQKHAFITHNNQKLCIQTPYFLTETYGAPRAGEYYQTLKSRAFYKMPFCFDRREFADEVDYDAVAVLHDKLVEIDALMSSAETKHKLFGEKNAEKYDYVPIVRQPQVSDDDENVEHKKYYRPAYAKVKLDLAVETEIPRFRLFDSPIGKRVEVQMKSIEDALKQFRFMTKRRMILNVFKVYASKAAGPARNENTGWSLHQRLWNPRTKRVSKTSTKKSWISSWGMTKKKCDGCVI